MEFNGKTYDLSTSQVLDIMDLKSESSINRYRKKKILTFCKEDGSGRILYNRKEVYNLTMKKALEKRKGKR